MDWSKAFDRQDPKLGIESFIRNGVRATTIPLLISYFQNRKMLVKWHGLTSTVRDLPGVDLRDVLLDSWNTSPTQIIVLIIFQSI